MSQSIPNVLALYARATGRMPEACETGRHVNGLLDIYSEGSDVSLRGIIERATQHDGCLGYVTCLSCPTGARLAADDLFEVTGVGIPEQVIQELCSPWQREIRDTPYGESPRVWPAQCPKGAVIRQVGEAAAIGFYPQCLDYSSCIECPVARGQVEDQLQDLLEYGWEGETGRKLRAACGSLMR